MIAPVHWRRTILVVLTALAIRPWMAGAAPQSVASNDGVRIEYEVIGDSGPALVFVHGWSCDRSYWSGQVEAFAREARVVAIDLAGHGGSGLNRTEWTVAAFGADVAAVIRKLDLKDVVLIGHSMGSDVIVEAARQLPGRVAGLVWVDRYNDLDALRTGEQIAAMMGPFRDDFAGATRTFVSHLFPQNADVALRDRVAADMSSAPPAVAVPALESTLQHEQAIPAALDVLRLPVVTINAGYQPTNVESMQRHGVQVIVMPDVGHFLMMEKPDAFNVLLRQAVARF